MSLILTLYRKNKQAVALIEAVHNNETARQSSDNSAEGLSRRLYLSIGCRIMLRRNICVDKGLVNGSLGTVRTIAYHNEERPPSLPYLLLIEFDKYTGPFLPPSYNRIRNPSLPSTHSHFLGNRHFPLLPTIVSWREQSVECTRRQFPINLAYALTIHKAQGLTLDKVVVDIGDRETSPGISYIAFSRVRRIEDLLILKAFNYMRLSLISQQV